MRDGIQIGEIVSAKEIARSYKHIWLACVACKKERWVNVSNLAERVYTGMCIVCSGKSRSGESHPSWKGGRIPDGHGYIKIKKPNHPLSNKEGYILEHRFVAAEQWGIEAVRGMVVHHKDGNRSNNAIENLESMLKTKHMRLHIKKPNSTVRLPREPNIEVSCACGCGLKFLKYAKTGKLRTYAYGHNRTCNVKYT